MTSHQRLTSGPVDWVRRVHEQRGTELTGTTWGVIGLGAIGRAVAKKAHGAFECRILAYSPHAPRELAGRRPARVVNPEVFNLKAGAGIAGA